jgi:riboflavin synthase
MFTGIIEEVGRVRSLELDESGGALTLAGRKTLKSLQLGSSIAVNGICLTVVRRGTGWFRVDVSPETTSRTGLGALAKGDPINLERPLKLSDRLGGHLVTGHVDGVAVVEAIEQRKEFVIFLFRAPADLARLLVPKGSVAVDGISLTINGCDGSIFSTAIVPHTLRHTNLRVRRVGDKVNVETDIIGKYIHRFLTA